MHVGSFHTSYSRVQIIKFFCPILKQIEVGKHWYITRGFSVFVLLVEELLRERHRSNKKVEKLKDQCLVLA